MEIISLNHLVCFSNLEHNKELVPKSLGSKTLISPEGIQMFHCSKMPSFNREGTSSYSPEHKWDAVNTHKEKALFVILGPFKASLNCYRLNSH